MTKELGFKITVIGSQEQLSGLASIERQLKSLNDQRKQLNKTLKEGIPLSTEESTALASLRAQINSLNAQRRESLKTIELQAKAMNGETNSAIQISAKLALLRRDYDLLSEAERQSAAGMQMQEKIQALDTEIKNLDGSVGRFQRNVGNYALALQNAGENGDLLTKILRQMKTELAGLDQSSKEFTDLNNQIQTVEASIAKLNGNINRQTRSFNGLSNSINQISRELPAFTYSVQTGFLALSNNIPILTDEIARLRAENLKLAESGQPTVSVFKQITSALFSWQTLLSVGITLITVFGGKIYELITGTKQLTEAQKKAAEETKGYSLQMIEQNKRADQLLETQKKLNKEIERFVALQGDNNDYKDIGEVIGIISRNGDLASISVRDLESALSSLKKVREDLSVGSVPILPIDGETPEAEEKRRRNAYDRERQSLDSRIKLLQDAINKRKPVEEAEYKRQEKAVEDLTNRLLSLTREYNEAEISLIKSKFERDRAAERERYRQRIEDLELQKKEYPALTSEINKLIEAENKIHYKNDTDILTAYEAEQKQIRDLAAQDLQKSESLKRTIRSEALAQTLEDQEKVREEAKKRAQVDRDNEAELNNENYTAIGNSAIESARVVSSTISQIKRDALQRDLQRETDSIKAQSETELSILKNQLDKGLITEAQFAKKKEEIDKKTAEKTLEAQKKAFEEKKRLDTNAAIMNGALAITSILAQYPKFDFGVAAAAAIVAAGITTAAQVAQIQKQEFAESGLVMPEDLTSGRSGKVGNRQNIRTKPNGDNVLATVKVGEVFLNKRHQEMLGGDATFAAIGVPGFAGSGLISRAPVINNTPPTPITFGGVTGGNYLTREQMADLLNSHSDKLATLINSKKVYVSEAEIRETMVRVQEYDDESKF